MSRSKSLPVRTFRPPCHLEPLESRQLLSGSVTPSFVPVTISAGALSADPSLSNYETFDLKVTLTGTNDWASGDLFVTLKSGNFYIPSGHSTTVQQSAWAADPNLQFDTFISAPSFSTSPVVLGRFKNGPGNAQIDANTIDVAWGDLVTSSPGTYTIARLTMTKGAVGSAEGRVGNTDTPSSPFTFTSSLPLSASGGQITGYIWNDLDSDGGKDGVEANFTERPQVYLDTNNNGHHDTGEVSARARTNGNYTFSNVAAGTYRVRINTPTGFRRSAPKPKFSWNVTIISGGAAAGKRFGITEQVQIAGTVFNDGNSNGVKNTGELGREGFTVFLDTDGDGSLDAGELSTVSDSSGTFILDGLDPGTYIVRVADKKGFRRTTKSSYTVTLGSGETKTNVLFGEKKL
jgi:hypothetical protein